MATPNLSKTLAALQAILDPVETTDIEVCDVLYESILTGAGGFDTGALGDLSEYSRLEIDLEARSSATGTEFTITVILNDDTTTSNYLRQEARAIGGSISSSQNASNPHAVVTGASATANEMGAYHGRILNPTSGHTKRIVYEGGARAGASAASYRAGVLFWSGTAAISRIRYQTDNHPTSQFVAGSSCRIIGVRKRTILTIPSV